MAHDVGFYDATTKEPICYFFGYAGGIFYSAFDAQHCDAGLSGSNAGVYRSAQEIRQGIDMIKNSTAYKNYPDPDRITEVLEKLEAFLEAHPTGRVFIHYS